jgi:hypothetical protein
MRNIGKLLCDPLLQLPVEFVQHFVVLLSVLREEHFRESAKAQGSLKGLHPVHQAERCLANITSHL